MFWVANRFFQFQNTKYYNYYYLSFFFRAHGVGGPSKEKTVKAGQDEQRPVSTARGIQKKRGDPRHEGNVCNEPRNSPRPSDVAQDLERGLQRLNLGLTLGNALLVGNASIDALRLDLLVVEKRGLEFLCFFMFFLTFILTYSILF